MRTVIEKIIVEHPVLGPLEKWVKSTYDKDNNLVDREFWGYDQIGINNGGKQFGDWVNDN